MHVELDELRGRKVFDANGRAIGRVKAALVDMETWLVDTLRIRVTRRAAADLDMHWSYFRWPKIDVTTGLIHAAGDAIIRLSLDAGGVLSGEHGIGLEKRDLMPLLFTPVDLDHQNRLRRAFDPDGRMNPGKVLPTGASCGDVQHLDRAPDGAWV